MPEKKTGAEKQFFIFKEDEQTRVLKLEGEFRGARFRDLRNAAQADAEGEGNAVKITVNRKALAEELRLCGYAVAKRDVIPIMKCVLLRAEGERLTVSATDLDVTLVTSIPAEIEESGATVVDFDVLRRSVAESPEDEVTLSLDDALRLTVTSGAFSIKVPVRHADDFPTIPETPETQITAPWATVQDLIVRVSHAISDHDGDGFPGGSLPHQAQSEEVAPKNKGGRPRKHPL